MTNFQQLKRKLNPIPHTKTTHQLLQNYELYNQSLRLAIRKFDNPSHTKHTHNPNQNRRQPTQIIMHFRLCKRLKKKTHTDDGVGIVHHSEARRVCS